MVADDRFKLLSFTGSPSVGWKMKAEAGKKKVVLELGGNAGAIVDETPRAARSRSGRWSRRYRRPDISGCRAWWGWYDSFDRVASSGSLS
jgi:hypothetical protein